MTYDLLVVGGGIQGAAVARDAALRGLSVLLLERGDLASGTSSRSSKLIHGGIRYLETGQFRLVREALRERARLLDLAAEFVQPLPFLIPHYRGEGRSPFVVGLGLDLYAALAGRHPLSAHRKLSGPEALALEPSLNPESLLGASFYWDARMEDAPLCVAVALAAERAGAALRTHTALVGLDRDGALWRARFRDAISGEEGETSSRCVVNAAGPWVEAVRALAGFAGRVRVRRTRGTHVVVPAALTRHALLLTARRDGRAIFAIPWGRFTLVGTTDVDDDAPPDAVRPTAEEVRYLLEEASRALPDVDATTRPLRVFVGVRSLVSGNAIRPWSNTREDRMLEEGTLLTLIGGKYTTHRSLAERVVDRVARILGARVAACRTQSASLATGRTQAIAALRAAYPGRVSAGEGWEIGEAEVVHAIRAERARRLEDILLRRTRLWLDARALRAAAEPVAAWMAPHLGWSDERCYSEAQALLSALDEEDGIIDSAMEKRRRGE